MLWKAIRAKRTVCEGLQKGLLKQLTEVPDGSDLFKIFGQFLSSQRLTS